MTISVKVNDRSLGPLLTWVRRGLPSAGKDKRVLSPFIRAFGRSNDWNFSSEISPTGRSWQALSPATSDVRELRGYDPDHPIMEQSGQLRAVSTTPFIRWRNGQASISTRTANPPYDDSGPISVSASANNGTFTATISGSRVANQYGGVLPGDEREGSRGRTRKPFLPARPFWGLRASGDESIDEALPEAMRLFMQSWREKASRGMRF